METIVAWSPNNYACARITNTEKGLANDDVYGTTRVMAWNVQRTSNSSFPLRQSPVYIVGPKGMKVSVRANPGW